MLNNKIFDKNHVKKQGFIPIDKKQFTARPIIHTF
jgi:hypothetical protein